MIDLLHTFIKVKRTGNWQLHLQTLCAMLPYFALADHNLYTKSGYVYLQQMNDLETSHREMYNNFNDGLHVVRRSDCYLAGLSTDLVTEQVLMRSIRTTGGLTREHGMAEIQCLEWLLFMPVYSEINNAMHDFTHVTQCNK